MAIRHRFGALSVMILFVGHCAELRAASTIEVVAKSAKVKVEQQTIAVVEKGQKYPLLKTSGAWLAIRIGDGESAKNGWVLASDVRVLPDPSVTDDSAAPLVPVDVRLSIDLTQFSPAWGPQSSMFFKVRIDNESPETIDFKVADLQLKVDDQPLPAMEHQNFGGYPIFTDPSMRAQVHPSGLAFLKDTTLAANASTEGWLGFSVAGLQQLLFTPGALATKTWIFEGKVGPHPVRIDLKEVEQNIIADEPRGSKLDPSVKVVEIGSRINALNAGKVLELMKALPAGSQGCIVILSNKDCLVDGMATQNFQQQMYQIFQGSNLPVLVKEAQSVPVYGYGYQNYFENGQLQHMPSEAAAALTILGRRPNTGEALIKHLENDDKDIRAAAARALTAHLVEANVVNALAKTAGDTDVTVRVAAVGALGGARVSQPDIRQDGTADTVALIKAMGDADSSVRTTAAQTAGQFPCDQVRGAVIKMLDDVDFATKVAAVQTAGTLEVKAAVPKLKELQADANPQMKTAAIDSLMKLGELTPLEGAISKLDNGQPQDADFTAIGQAKDKRAVEPLIAMLKIENNYQMNFIARTLGQIGDPRAVDPLLRTFMFGNRNYGMEEVPRALGKLGDRRAIDPLRQSLMVPNNNMQPELRGASFEALLQLKAPNILDEANEELKKMIAANRHWEARTIVQALGRSHDAKVISTLEPLLDDQQLSIPACTALFQLGTRSAHAVLEGKLNSADYQLGQMVLMNQQWPRTAAAVAFLKRLKDSKNNNTRMAAEQALNSLQASAPGISSVSGPSPIGYIAPSIDGENDVDEWIDGKSAKDLKGKVTMILLPDTSGAAPQLFAESNKCFEKFSGKGLAVVALWKLAGWNWDAQTKSISINPNSTVEQERRAVGELAKLRGIKYPVGLISSTSGLTEKFGGPGGDRVALIDRSGVLQVVRSISADDFGSLGLESLILELLDEPAASENAMRIGRQIPPPPDVPKLPRSAVLAYAATRFDPDSDSSTIPVHHDTVWSVQFAPDGKSIATTSADATARLWDLTSGKLQHALNGHEGLVRHSVFNRDGTKIFTSGFDKTIRVWDTASGTLEKTLTDDAPVFFLSLFDDGKTLISSSEDLRLRQWNLTDGQVKRYFSGHTGKVWVTSSATGKSGHPTIVSGSVDRTVRIWDFASGNAQHVLNGHAQDINTVAISSDAKIIASGAGEVILWNAATGEEKLRIAEPGSFVYDLAFSPDEKTLAVGRANHTVTLYDLATGKTVKQWNRGGWCVNFSRDGKQLASGSDDRTIRIWRLSSDFTHDRAR